LLLLGLAALSETVVVVGVVVVVVIIVEAFHPRQAEGGGAGSAFIQECAVSSS